MRDFNKVNPSLWGSQKFNSLSQQDKLLYFYFLTCPHSNSAGFFRCPIGYMTSDLKMDEKGLRKGIERVCHTLLIGYDFNEETVLLCQWFRFNPPSNPNHAKKVFNDILGLSDCNLKFECLQQFKDCLVEKHWTIPEELNEILKGYRKGIERVSPLEETRPDQTRPEETESISEAFSSYNEIAKKYGLPIAQKLTSSRKSKLRSRLKDCGGLDGWKTAMDKLSESNFLTGQNDNGWKADFDFILQEKSFTKLMEGSYDNRKGNKNGKSNSERTLEGLREWVDG